MRLMNNLRCTTVYINHQKSTLPLLNLFRLQVASWPRLFLCVIISDNNTRNGKLCYVYVNSTNKAQKAELLPIELIRPVLITNLFTVSKVSLLPIYWHSYIANSTSTRPTQLNTELINPPVCVWCFFSKTTRCGVSFDVHCLFIKSNTSLCLPTVNCYKDKKI